MAVTRAERARRAHEAVNDWIAQEGFICPGVACRAHAAFDLKAWQIRGTPEFIVLCQGCHQAAGHPFNIREESE